MLLECLPQKLNDSMQIWNRFVGFLIQITKRLADFVLREAKINGSNFASLFLWLHFILIVWLSFGKTSEAHMLTPLT